MLTAQQKSAIINAATLVQAFAAYAALSANTQKAVNEFLRTDAGQTKFSDFITHECGITGLLQPNTVYGFGNADADMQAYTSGKSGYSYKAINAEEISRMMNAAPSGLVWKTTNRAGEDVEYKLVSQSDYLAAKTAGKVDFGASTETFNLIGIRKIANNLGERKTIEYKTGNRKGQKGYWYELLGVTASGKNAQQLISEDAEGTRSAGLLLHTENLVRVAAYLGLSQAQIRQFEAGDEEVLNVNTYSTLLFRKASAGKTWFLTSDDAAVAAAEANGGAIVNGQAVGIFNNDSELAFREITGIASKVAFDADVQAHNKGRGGVIEASYVADTAAIDLLAKELLKIEAMPISEAMKARLMAAAEAKFAK